MWRFLRSYLKKRASTFASCRLKIGQKKRLDDSSLFNFLCAKEDYFTEKLALLASCLASAEDLSTEVSSPYPL